MPLLKFQAPFTYKYLEEFIFENGVYIETRALSKKAKEHKKKNKNPLKRLQNTFPNGLMIRLI